MSIKSYLVIDLEATCWDKSDKQLRNETIEIGCCLVEDNQIVFKKSWFVRPLQNPILSDFCKTLTSITQEQVDCAKLFPETLLNFQDEIESTAQMPLNKIPFISWGNFDRNQFKRDCSLHKIAYPFGKHTNLKKNFLSKYKVSKASMTEALKIAGLEFKGTLHRGLDDAVNLARMFIQTFDGKLEI